MQGEQDCSELYSGDEASPFLKVPFCILVTKETLVTCVPVDLLFLFSRSAGGVQGTKEREDCKDLNISHHSAL